MLKHLSVILICLVASSYTFGQSFFYDDKYYDADLLYEAGISFGLMNGITDVGEHKGNGFSPGYYNWKSSHTNISIYAGVLYKSTVEARIELTKGTVAGDDANSNSPYVRSRNINYKSKVFEASLIAGFHPLMLRNTETLPVISPYIMTGLGVFSYDPKTLYDGEWIGLRSMHTEGQTTPAAPAKKPYGSMAISIPVGLGVKYEINAKYNLRLEALGRFTSTDYLDDVSTIYVDRAVFPTDIQKILAHRYNELNSQIDRTGLPRGNANNKDKFFTINLRLGYVIGRKKIPINYNPNP